MCYSQKTVGHLGVKCILSSLSAQLLLESSRLIQQTLCGSLGSNRTPRTPAISSTMGQHRELSSESQTEFKRNLHFSLVLRPAAEHLLRHSPLHLCYSFWVALPSTRNWERAGSSEFAESCIFVCHSVSACCFFFFFFNFHQQNRKCRVYDLILKNKSSTLPLLGFCKHLLPICLHMVSTPSHFIKLNVVKSIKPFSYSLCFYYLL